MLKQLLLCSFSAYLIEVKILCNVVYLSIEKILFDKLHLLSYSITLLKKEKHATLVFQLSEMRNEIDVIMVFIRLL